jgi:serpin B
MRDALARAFTAKRFRHLFVVRRAIAGRATPDRQIFEARPLDWPRGPRLRPRHRLASDLAAMTSAHRVQVPLLLTLLAGAACLSSATSPSDKTTEVRSEKVRITAPVLQTQDLATLAADNRHFAWDLYQAVRTEPGNLAFSPASLSLALAMSFGGARGATATQMAAAMRFSLPPGRLHPTFDALDLALETPPTTDGVFRLSLTNALWSQDSSSLLPDFLDLLAENYGADVHVVDFAGAPDGARMTINQWVSDATQAKIPELLAQGAIDPLTTLVLTNAVYFHADWQTSFAAPSVDGTFETPTGPVEVPMMSGSHVPVAGWSGAGYESASIPYAGGTAAFVVIVPDAGTFNAFEAGLTFDALEALLSPDVASTKQVLVTMPRFKAETHLGLAATLARLGMTDAFSVATLTDRLAVATRTGCTSMDNMRIAALTLMWPVRSLTH